VVLAAFLIPAGAVLFVVGLRIAYNHRGAGDTYLRVTRGRLPRWWPRLKPETERMLDGSVIGALGVVLAGLAILSFLR
jgi:hypothetical protein